MDQIGRGRGLTELESVFFVPPPIVEMGATDAERKAPKSLSKATNPGPHGPEPCWLHALQCPGGSRDARLNTNCRSLVSVRVP